MSCALLSIVTHLVRAVFRAVIVQIKFDNSLYLLGRAS